MNFLKFVQKTFLSFQCWIIWIYKSQIRIFKHLLEVSGGYSVFSWASISALPGLPHHRDGASEPIDYNTSVDCSVAYLRALLKEYVAILFSFSWL